MAEAGESRIGFPRTRGDRPRKGGMSMATENVPLVATEMSHSFGCSTVAALAARSREHDRPIAARSASGYVRAATTRALYERDDPARLPAAFVPRLRRILFRFEDGGAVDADLIDYH